MTGIPSHLAEIGTLVMTFAGGLPGLLTSALSTAGTWLWNTGIDVINGLTGGMLSGLEAFRLGVGQWITDYIVLPVKSFLGISSPSTVFMQIGSDIVAGLAAGVSAVGQYAIQPLVAGFQWVMDQAAAMQAFLASVWAAMATAAAAAWNWVNIYAIQPLLAGFQWVWDKAIAIKDGVIAAFQAMSDRVGQVWDGIKSLAMEPVRFVVDTVLNKGLIDTYNTIAGWFPGAPKLDHLAAAVRTRWAHPRAVTDRHLRQHPHRGDRRGVHAAGRGREPLRPGGHGEPAHRATRGRCSPPVGWSPRWAARTPRGVSYPGHTGLDFPVGMGTPVVAALDGIVNAVKQMTTSYGIHVRMTHAGGLESIYAHLQSAAVAAGQALKAGDRLGLSDSTGNSTGAHLHFELRQDGNPFDPTAMLEGAAAPPGRRRRAARQPAAAPRRQGQRRGQRPHQPNPGRYVRGARQGHGPQGPRRRRRVARRQSR